MSVSSPLFRTATVALPDGNKIDLRVRRSERAKRISLRVIPASGGFELVVPIRASIKQGLSFARDKASWLKAHLATLPPPVPFEDGAVIPLLDQPKKICRSDELFRSVWLIGKTLHVAAPPENVPEDIRRWLQNRAKDELKARAEDKSQLINQQFRRITVGDMASRWGSCSPKGDLSFSWRIIMAPEYALDYLVAHEVSHLKEMNHSKRFWTIVNHLTDDLERGRAWLRDQGASLHRFGFDPRS